MAKLKKGRVKASTLLEVIIAMVIILVVFSLSMGIYTHVISSTPSVKQQQVKIAAGSFIQQSINAHNWSDEQLTQDSIEMVKTVLPYEKYTDLLQITVTVYEQEKPIHQSRRIVRKTAGHD